MTTPMDDAIGRLLAASDAETLLALLQTAYAAGWADAFDAEGPPIEDARIAALVEAAAVAHQSRIARGPIADGGTAPDWLRRQMEQQH